MKKVYPSSPAAEDDTVMKTVSRKIPEKEKSTLV